MKRLIVGLAAVVVLVGVAQSEAGLIAHWNLDGNGLDSADSHDGTVYGASGTQDRFNHANSAMFFNGSTDYVAVANHPDLNPGAITITAWFRADSFALGSYSWPVILKQENGHILEIVQVYESTPGLAYSECIDGVYRNSGILPVSADTWYFIAGVYDGATISSYLGSQGQPLSETHMNVSGDLSDSSYDLSIGRDAIRTSQARYFHGAIDDVRIYDTALTVSQINNLHNPVPEPSSLIVWCMLGAIGPGLAWYRRRKAA